MQKLPKLLGALLLFSHLTTKAMDTLENELMNLSDELNGLEKALSSGKKPITQQPIPSPQPITTGHKGLQVIGERTLPNGKKIIVGIGDVEKIENVDAVMNAANANLLFGSGVAGSIATALGSAGQKQVYAEIATKKIHLPVQVGSATPTKVPAGTTLSQRGFKYIIHAVGPDCRVPAQERQWQTLLSDAYENSLNEAAKLNLTSITIPPLSIGVFQCDYKTALNIMMNSITTELLRPSSIQEVILVVWSGGKNPTKTAAEWLNALDTAILIFA